MRASRVLPVLLVAAFAVMMFSTVALASASAKSSTGATKKVKCKKGYTLQTGVREGKKRTFCVKHGPAKNGASGTGRAGSRVPPALRALRVRRGSWA